jgi:membrane protease YdiL (CAAX protease family)
MQPPALRLSFRQLLAIIAAQLLALTTQAWLSRILLARGYEQLQAHYLAYLAGPTILLLMLGPILLEQRHLLQRLLSPRVITLRLVLAAVVLGVTMRVIWWAQLVARIAFGITRSGDPQAVAGPAFSWDCPPMSALFPGLLVMAVLTPLMEETVHRGLLLSAFVHRGPLPAVLISTLIFTAFHPPSSYGFVFLMGVILGVQFWLTRSLLATILTHAAYNGIAQLDWRCLQGHWNPPPESLPQVAPGSVALLVLAAAVPLVLAQLHYQRTGAQAPPAAATTRTRSQRVR